MVPVIIKNYLICNKNHSLNSNYIHTKYFIMRLHLLSVEILFNDSTSKKLFPFQNVLLKILKTLIISLTLYNR